jgi:putative oxidoreductase
VDLIDEKEYMLKNFYACLAVGESSLRHFFFLSIRLYWGALFLMTGFGKLSNGNAVATFFTEVHVPFPELSSYLVGLLELFGGLSLILGLFSRIFSLLLATMLFSAYFIAHQEALSQIFTNPSLFVMQDPFLFLYTTLVVLCFGPGVISMDFWIEKKVYGQSF